MLKLALRGVTLMVPMLCRRAWQPEMYPDKKLEAGQSTTRHTDGRSWFGARRNATEFEVEAKPQVTVSSGRGPDLMADVTHARFVQKVEVQSHM